MDVWSYVAIAVVFIMWAGAHAYAAHPSWARRLRRWRWRPIARSTPHSSNGIVIAEPPKVPYGRT